MQRSFASFFGIVFIFLVFAFQINAQDTLVFKNGNIVAVEITSISEDKKLIQAKQENKELLVSLQAILRYKYQNQWIDLPDEEQVALYPYEIKDRLINRSFLEERSGLSIGSNLSSLFLGITEKDYQRFPYSIRPLLTIEPEYRLKKNDKISFKGSLEVGLPFPNINNGPELRVGSTGYSFYNGIVNYYFYDSNIQNANVYPNFERFKGCYIPFQSGASLKFWPSSFLRERFYLSLGLMVGVADYQAFTVYDSFESTLDEWNNQQTRFVGQTYEVQKNSFVFTRMEFGWGYHFQLTKKFSLNLDLTFSQRPRNKGQIPDVVYARIDNQDFVKMYEGVYQGGNNFDVDLLGNIFLKVRFFYHFTK